MQCLAPHTACLFCRSETVLLWEIRSATKSMGSSVSVGKHSAAKCLGYVHVLVLAKSLHAF